MQKESDFPLPSDLPRPVDDGAATHLVGMMLPKLGLRSTAGRVVELSELSALHTVIYCYPMTGVPGKPLPENWVQDEVPTAAMSEGVRGYAMDATTAQALWKKSEELVGESF